MSEEWTLGATPGVSEKTKIKKGSEEMVDHVCDICLVVKKTRNAIGYCEECQQFLCKVCSIQHTQIKATKYHKLISSEDSRKKRVSKPLFMSKLIPVSSYVIPTKTKKGAEYSTTQFIQLSTLKLGNNTVNAVLFGFEHNYTTETFCHAFDENATTVLSQTVGDMPVSCMLQSISDERMVYFSVPDSRIMRIFKLDITPDCSTLYFDDSFKTSGECFGMTNFNDGIASLIKIETHASGIPDLQLQFLDYNGKIKQRICYTSNGKPLFHHPQQLATNNEQTVLFVLESPFGPEQSHILALDITGEVLFKIGNQQNLSFSNASSLAVDDENNIYIVCLQGAFGNRVADVLQIHSGFHKSRILFSLSTRFTCKVGFDKATKTLLVAGDKNPEVVCYTFC